MSVQVIPLYNQEDVLSDDAQNILNSLKSEVGNAPSILVGSGISLWTPTDLPSGQNFTRAMFSVLFEDYLNLSPSQNKTLEKVFGYEDSPNFSGMPFEHLMECCPSEQKANQLLSDLYNCHHPNSLHYALAKGLKKGTIHSIITTNYDSCIEEALFQLNVNFFKVTNSEQIKKSIKKIEKELCYFKIHGSAENEMESNIMFSLKHEKLLDPEKRKLLQKLTNNRPLILLGYSGLDFELCPEIERLNVSQIIWNNLKNKYPSVSAKRVIENKCGILLYGDMRFFIENLFGKIEYPKLTEDKTNYVKEKVRQTFTDIEIDSWRVKVLNSLGIPSFALKILNKNNTKFDSHFKKTNKGRSHFHAGRYKTARFFFKRTMANELISKKPETAADAALELSDAYRSYGSPVRAYLCTFAVDILSQKTLMAKKLLKQALIIKDHIELFNFLKKFIDTKSGRALRMVSFPVDTCILTLKNILSKKLLKCAKEALNTGNWIDFQQVSLIAESLHIDVSITDKNYYSPPKANEGYKHLGYYIPQTMVFYDKCLSGKDVLAENVEMRQEWKRHIKLCKQFGINSSLWKILALSKSPKIKDKARDIFVKCEYGFFKGLADWKKFSSKSS